MPTFLQTEEDQTDEKVSFSRRVNPKCNIKNGMCQALARKRLRVNRRGSGIEKKERQRYSDSLKAHLVIVKCAHT